jgi:hypothetical protein
LSDRRRLRLHREVEVAAVSVLGTHTKTSVALLISFWSFIFYAFQYVPHDAQFHPRCHPSRQARYFVPDDCHTVECSDDSTGFLSQVEGSGRANYLSCRVERGAVVSKIGSSDDLRSHTFRPLWYVTTMMNC